MKSARTQDGSAELPAKEVLLPSCFVYADSMAPADFKNLKFKGADFMKSIKRDTQHQREIKKKWLYVNSWGRVQTKVTREPSAV